jgi:pimeloyl-ACP methyl ester carboxylesterase
MITPALLRKPRSLVVALVWTLPLFAAPGADAGIVVKKPVAPIGTAKPAGTETVLYVTSRGHEIPTLIDTPHGAPIGAVILLAGGKGRLDIKPDGTIAFLTGNQLVRSRQKYTEAGFLTLLPDLAPNFKTGSKGVVLRYSTSQAYADDIGAMVKILRAKLETPLLSPPQVRLPVVVIGTSYGSIRAANAVAKLKAPSRPDGAVLTSAFLMPGQPPSTPIQRAKANLPPILETVRGAANDNPALLAIPMLVAWNTNDTCPETSPSGWLSFEQWYGNTLPQLSSHAFTSTGMQGTDPCQGFTPHGFWGIDDEVVQYTVSWIKTTFLSSLQR